MGEADEFVAEMLGAVQKARVEHPEVNERRKNVLVQADEIVRKMSEGITTPIGNYGIGEHITAVLAVARFLEEW